MAQPWIRNGIIVLLVVVGVAAIAVLRKDSAPPTAGNDRTAVAREATASAPSGLPRIVDPGADKCIPCKQMAPILAALKTEYAGKATIEFIDVWKDPAAGQEHGVRLIPTQIFYDREGKEVWRHEGFLAKKDIVKRLSALGA